MNSVSNYWESKQRIMVILAHPDDPEFFCGGTLACWVHSGHEIIYCLLTQGDKGANDISINIDDLKIIRQKEQKAAAAIIGVNTIIFLNNEDGFIERNNNSICDVVRLIRKYRPEIVITCDPTNYFPRDNYFNHPDHRVAGEIVVNAIFPACGNPFYFPELLKEGNTPYTPREVWLSLTLQPNTIIDVTEYWSQKLTALHEHRSQIGDQKEFDQRMLKRRTIDSTDDSPRFEEKFRRFIFS